MRKLVWPRNPDAYVCVGGRGAGTVVSAGWDMGGENGPDSELAITTPTKPPTTAHSKQHIRTSVFYRISDTLKFRLLFHLFKKLLRTFQTDRNIGEDWNRDLKLGKRMFLGLKYFFF